MGKSFKKRLSSMLGNEEPEEPSLSDEIASLCPKLTYTQRLYGFCSCFFLGFLLSLGSFSNFIELLTGNPIPFVVMYTLGNIVSLSATMFLSGPKSQWKSMSKDGRRFISVIYVLSLIVSLVVCFITFPKDLRALQGTIIILLLIIQFCSMIWYSLSYIPYGRATAKSCCLKNCSCCMEEVDGV